MCITVATLLALQCTLCLAIRVPIAWNDENSAVNKRNQFALEQFEHQNTASSNQQPIPKEYFQYPGQKPKFAIDIAKLHGVPSPEDHYKAYPIKPHTGLPKPELGKRQILNQEKNIYHPYREPVKKNEAIRVVSPSSTSYEVFHPYKLEQPALKELYQDPVMKKIRNDLENNKLRLQKYENEEGQPEIIQSEYLESPEEIDRQKRPHENVPAPYEIHRPQRRPVYYKPPFVHNQREQVLNQKLRHPLHQNHIKVKPIHYRPVKNHLQSLRQQHALKYDDERNEYPQLPIPEQHSVPPEGYDIYEKGKAKFVQLKNNVDESLNEAIQRNKPTEKHKLELSEDDYDEETNTDDEEDDFVPIKNYAQVRKTETTKHLPKEAAYHDADTLEEIQNAPRLREAIKSSKAQTVYSEEGYEDSAYDHAGEQKHASDHEEHRGLLKEKEQSNGKFKLPTLSTNYEDEKNSEYRNQVIDGQRWKDTKQNTDKETDLEEYSEKEEENSKETSTFDQNLKNSDNYDDSQDEGSFESREVEIKRIKREPINAVSAHDKKYLTNDSTNFDNDAEKLDIEESIPEIKIDKKSSTLAIPFNKKTDNVNDKYPYYYNKLKGINKNSPLRYAENLKFIPNKSEGGTEFYDSRAKFQCPEVEDNIDPIPEKLKKGGHPDEVDEDEYDDADDNNGEKHSDSNTHNQKPRLKGLGDKIDCFKAKYFGENPLDSPFFKEEIISNPEPVIIPSIDIYRLKKAKQQSTENSKLNDKKGRTEKEQKLLLPLVKPQTNQVVRNPHLQPGNENDVPFASGSKIANDQLVSVTSDNVLKSQIDSTKNQTDTKNPLQKKKAIQHFNAVRKRRAAPFVYEPYKIIRDSQIQDSKKTTTTNNISPLIKQLQSSRVVDKVTTNTGKEQIVKRSTGTRSYKDIGKTDREKNNESKGARPLYDASFVDVSVDYRRGEPRYELRSAANHKSQNSQEENRRSTTAEDNEAQTKSNLKNSDQQENKTHNRRKAHRRRRTTTTTRPYFDVSKFLPREEIHKSVQANHKTEIKSDEPITSQLDKSEESIKSQVDHAEMNENEEDKEFEESTSTTVKIPSRRKITYTTTTLNPTTEDDLAATDLPKLRLVTRFQNSYQTETPLISKRAETSTRSHEDEEKIKVPKYREKKKKISKSTLVTDTNSYGEDDDDDLSKEEEVDALIGVKHDIDEYIPTYEVEANKKDHSESQEGDEDDEEDDHTYDDEDEENDDDDDDDDDDDGEEEEEDDEEAEAEEDTKPKVTTTPEPTKRTLFRTTEAPLTTTEARSAKLEVEPVTVKKKLNIHKELPVNRSSPHVTEFKQDIKEVEIIKEIPSRIKKKPQKNIEALELYKDENLAKDINKLGGVEVFKENLDLINGPKHGGNYRIAEILPTDDSSTQLSLRRRNENSSIGDVVASPSKTSKIIEVKDDPYARRRSDIQRARNNRGRSAKLIELSDSTEKPTSRAMHGGNLKSIHETRRRGGNRNAKIIELVDQSNKDDHSTNKHDSNSRFYGSRGGSRHQMHSGNYRSAKLVKADDKVPAQTEKSPKIDSTTDVRQNSAALLNSFARAVSVLTTPTPYILDPSKRMYYYVEA